ncbi:MFS transporter [Paenibacillus caui]|uniref:MFS transporter n=1 Tax=Paenibacillus caui TaxID=2873927 RepID=UPI001CA80AD3|nr:MFS transporter [Paenibacillus caui]
MKKISLLYFLVMFVIGTDTFLISPLLPALRETYHISESMSGWMVSAYALGYALFALIAGPLSDGMDRKRTMIFGLIAFTISTALCGLAPSFWTMFLFRLLAGISAAIVSPQVWASIPALVKPESIIQVMGLATAGLSVSQMVGVPIGGWLAVYSWHTPFFAIAGAALVMTVVIGIALPPMPSVKKERKESILRIYQELLMAPRAVKYLAAYFIFQTGNFAAFSFIGSWFTADFSLDVAAVGTAMIALGLGNTIGSLFGSRLVRRLGQPGSLRAALLALIVLYILLPFSGNLVAAEIIFFGVFTIGGFVFPVFMSTLQSLTTTARGTVSALANATMYGGTTIGGAIGGVLLSGFPGFFGNSWFTAVLFIVSLLVYQSSGLFGSKAAAGVSAK